jgi:hypothetical protein
MTATATTETLTIVPPVVIDTCKTRDKYGRTVTEYRYLCRTVLVLVTLPRAAREAGLGGWMVTSWDKHPEFEAPSGVTFDNRKSAEKFAAAWAQMHGQRRAANVAAGLGNVA